VPVLVPPTASVHVSYLDAQAEFQAEGRNLEIDRAALANPALFARHIAALTAEADATAPRAPRLVPQTTLWYVDGDDFLGELAIRHWLTEDLRRLGGHIGYEVRPSERRRGHATEMLRLSLPIAHQLGIDPALVTCDDTNIASRKVIEKNGGVPDEPIPPKLRYWIPTS
jgi:predicted acetyltransferase